MTPVGSLLGDPFKQHQYKQTGMHIIHTFLINISKRVITSLSITFHVYGCAKIIQNAIHISNCIPKNSNLLTTEHTILTKACNTNYHYIICYPKTTSNDELRQHAFLVFFIFWMFAYTLGALVFSTVCCEIWRLI